MRGVWAEHVYGKLCIIKIGVPLPSLVRRGRGGLVKLTFLTF